MSEKFLFYFGNATVPGHYLYLATPQGLLHSVSCSEVPGFSRSLYSALDGAFYDAGQPGVYKHSYVPPFHIISWEDRSGDTRPGSHSTFIFVGHARNTETEVLLEIAKKECPSIFARQKVPLCQGIV